MLNQTEVDWPGILVLTAYAQGWVLRPVWPCRRPMTGSLGVCSVIEPIDDSGDLSGSTRLGSERVGIRPPRRCGQP